MNTKAQQDELWWERARIRGKVAYLREYVLDGTARGALVYLFVRAFLWYTDSLSASSVFSSVQASIVWLLGYALLAFFRGLSRWASHAPSA